MGAYLSEEEPDGQATKHWGCLVVLWVCLRGKSRGAVFHCRTASFSWPDRMLLQQMVHGLPFHIVMHLLVRFQGKLV